MAEFVRRDLAIRYAEAVMGYLWAFAVPVMVVGAGLMLRTVGGPTVGGGATWSSLLIKALPWTFFSGAIAAATQSIVGQATLIGRIYFPRESLPIAAVFGQLFDSAIASTVALGILLITRHPLTMSVFWLPVLAVLLVLFTTGCALLVSCGTLLLRDVKYVVQLALTFGLFATPVLVDPQQLGHTRATLLLWLPLSPFIQALDILVLHGRSLAADVVVTGTDGAMLVLWEPAMLLYAATLALGTFLLGLRAFRRASSHFAEYL